MDAIEWRPYPHWPRRSGWFLGPRCVDKSLRRLVLAKELYINYRTDGKQTLGFGKPDDGMASGRMSSGNSWKMLTGTIVKNEKFMMLKLTFEETATIQQDFWSKFPAVKAAWDKIVNAKLEQTRKDQLGSVSVDGLRSGGLGGGEDGCPPFPTGLDSPWWQDRYPWMVYGGDES